MYNCDCFGIGYYRGSAGTGQCSLQIMISLAKYIWNNLDQLGPVAVALIAKLATNLLLNNTKLLNAAGELVAKTASKLKADFLSKMQRLAGTL